MSKDGGRGAALLTKAQRDYLRGEKDYRPSVEREIKRRIRERLRASLLDMSLILRNFPPDQIKEALEIRDLGERGDPGDLSLEIGAADAFGIIHLAYRERDLGRSEGDFVATRVEKGMKTALNRLGKSVQDVDVSIEVNLGTDLDTFTEMTGGELAEFSIYELQQVLAEDRITSEQFMAAMEKKNLTHDEE